MALNVVALLILIPLRLLLPRIKTGYFFALYLALYSVSQFIVFFFRGSEPVVAFLGTHALKQAQWTAVFTLLLAGVIFWLARRYGVAWPFTASNPEPYPMPAGGLGSALAAAPAPVTALEPGKVARAARAARMTPVAEVAPTEVAPWQRGDSRFGALRNMFDGVGEFGARALASIPLLRRAQDQQNQANTLDTTHADALMATLDDSEKSKKPEKPDRASEGA
jgi:hypothetical protein